MAMIKPNRIYESNRTPRSFVLKLNPLISVHFIVYQRAGNRWRQTEHAGDVRSRGVYSGSHQSAPVVTPLAVPQSHMLICWLTRRVILPSASYTAFSEVSADCVYSSEIETFMQRSTHLQSDNSGG